MRALLVLFLCLFLSPPLYAMAKKSDTAAMVQKSKALAENKQYKEALSLLKKARADAPNDISIRLATARTLSWMGKFKEAQSEIDALAPEQKEMVDTQILQAYLYYYEQRFTKSEKIFKTVLTKYPEYTDALNGLAYVQKAMKTTPEQSYEWQADAGFESSNFARSNQESWNQEFFQLNHFSKDRDTVIYGRVERYDQFNNIDSAYELGVSHIFAPRFTAYASGTISPSADFRPDWRLAGGGAIRLDDPSDTPAFWLTLDGKRDSYANTDIITLNPGIRIEPKDGWAVSSRLITVSPRNEDRMYGWDLRLDGTITRGWRFRAGYANAPETDSGIAVDTKSVYGGFSYDISPTTTIHFNYTRDDRENSYIRNVYSAAISRKF